MTTKLFTFLEEKIYLHCANYLVDQHAEDWQNGRKLNLARFRLRTLPSVLPDCLFLSKLSLDGNFLSSASIVTLQSLTFLRHLALNDNALTEFPEELCRLKYVEFLNIGGNPIERLPEAVGRLKNLITLWCNDMLLECLPEAIGTLRRLKTLGVRNNQLGELPESLGELKRLRWLSVANNRIDKLPQSVGSLTGLKHFNLRGNHFDNLPEEISSLKRLKFCSFAENRLEKLSSDLLQRLKFIRLMLLDGNPLEPESQCRLNGWNSGFQKDVRFELNLLDEDVPEDWDHSVSNSELNLLDTSDEDDMDDDAQLSEWMFPWQARFSLSA